MRELSIEEKAKAYDDAIQQLRGMMPNWEYLSYNSKTFLQDLTYIFPELKESEDEKIRKELIEQVIYIVPDKNEVDDNGNTLPCYTTRINKYITWLEKQESVREIVERCKNSWYNEGKIQGQIEGLSDDEKYQQGWHDAREKQSEQKSSTEVAPKFHEGEWLIDKEDNTIFTITKVLEHSYKYITNTGKEYFCAHYSLEQDARPWTIQDTKDGDILASNLEENYISPFIAIYKERGLDYFTSYCFIGLDGKFYKGDTGHDMVGIHPATKEQCDLLFKKMKEAGYEWNPMTLKLNKEVIEDKKEISNEQKPIKWSAEDVRILQEIIYLLEGSNHPNKIHNGKPLDFTEMINWLKALKPWMKSELSEEDKERIQRIYTFLWKNRKGDTDTIYQIENDAEWLKNLNTK